MADPDEVERAFVTFARASSARLHRIGFLLTAGDQHLAEDLVQNALVATFTAWTRIRNPDAAFAFARTSLINAHRDHCRRRRNHELPVADAPDAVAIPQDGADDRITLLRGLSGLGPRQRQVVVLRYLEDLPDRQIAELLHCSVGTVKSQAFDALRRLRTMPELSEWRPATDAENEIPCR